jgi:hypothetical protein
MQPYEWFLLGMMVAWTPAVVVLAVMLRRAFTKPTEAGTEGAPAKDTGGIADRTRDQN